jgi:hypothetical protein
VLDSNYDSGLLGSGFNTNHSAFKKRQKLIQKGGGIQSSKKKHNGGGSIFSCIGRICASNSIKEQQTKDSINASSSALSTRDIHKRNMGSKNDLLIN